MTFGSKNNEIKYVAYRTDKRYWTGKIVHQFLTHDRAGNHMTTENINCASRLSEHYDLSEYNAKLPKSMRWVMYPLENLIDILDVMEK